jgi:hypothetical protein
MTNGDKTVCVNSDPKRKVETTVTDNGDGTTTTTTTTSTNVDGGGTQTTTTTTQPNGSNTTTTTYNPTAEDPDADGIPGNTGQGIGQSYEGSDGEGTGEGEGEGEGEESSVAGGTDCVTAPSCTGDAIQCAILYQQWKSRCSLEGDTDYKDESIFTDGTSSIAEWTEGTGPGSKITQDLSDLIDFELGAAPACPAPQSVNVLGRSFEFEWDPMCDFALGVRPFVLIATAAFVVILIVREV